MVYYICCFNFTSFQTFYHLIFSLLPPQGSSVLVILVCSGCVIWCGTEDEGFLFQGHDQHTALPWLRTSKQLKPSPQFVPVSPCCSWPGLGSFIQWKHLCPAFYLNVPMLHSIGFKNLYTHAKMAGYEKSKIFYLYVSICSIQPPKK